MHLQHEESIEKDIGRIRGQIVEMARRTESSLKDTLKAILDNDHTLAYGVILRDQFIDEKEKEIDRLCLEFIVKQQPVAHALRLAFSAIKLTLEIERVGDYAESMARHMFKMKEWPAPECKNDIVKMAELAIGMFHNAIQSFIEESAEMAKTTILTEEKVDELRDACINNLLAATRNSEPPMPLFNIIRRFERVADQARNICLEVLYLTTGEYVKHPGSDVFRVLFIDVHNSLRSRIAEAVANGLNQPRFIFSSAGIDPRPIDSRIVEFMKRKGYDLSNTASHSVLQIPNLDLYHVIVAFAPEVKKVFPRELRKTIYLDWEIAAPSLAKDDAETIEAGLENVFNFVSEHISGLVNAISGSSKK